MDKKIKNIVIANDAEAFKLIIGSIKNSDDRIAKINKEHFLSNRFLFWEEDNKIVITPFAIEKALITQAQKIGFKNIENWYPSKTCIQLSMTILQDRTLLRKLKSTIEENPGVILSPYSYTEDFANLSSLLRREGLRFSIDQEPNKGCEWLVTYLGSKVGFRVEIQKLQATGEAIPIPEYFIATDKAEIVRATMWFYERNKSCVIKAFSGEGGWGVLMVHKKDYSSSLNLSNMLESRLSTDSIWNYSPYVIEEFIASTPNGQNSPSLEIFIDENETKITYVCNQIVDSSGRFLGILMGKDCLESNLQSRLCEIGQVIGNKYSNLGYRGFFDIDFIVSEGGTPYPIETNVRRTGGTHVFDLSKYIFGKDWFKKTVVLSSDSFMYTGTILSAEAILDKINEIAFPIKDARKGVVIAAVGQHEPIFAFVIFASTKNELMQIHKKLTKIWS